MSLKSKNEIHKLKYRIIFKWRWKNGLEDDHWTGNLCLSSESSYIDTLKQTWRRNLSMFQIFRPIPHCRCHHLLLVKLTLTKDEPDSSITRRSITRRFLVWAHWLTKVSLQEPILEIISEADVDLTTDTFSSNELLKWE